MSKKDKKKEPKILDRHNRSHLNSNLFSSTYGLTDQQLIFKITCNLSSTTKERGSQLKDVDESKIHNIT